jgi:hypothetical protein
MARTAQSCGLIRTADAVIRRRSLSGELGGFAARCPREYTLPRLPSLIVLRNAESADPEVTEPESACEVDAVLQCTGRARVKQPNRLLWERPRTGLGRLCGRIPRCWIGPYIAQGGIRRFFLSFTRRRRSTSTSVRLKLVTLMSPPLASFQHWCSLLHWASQPLTRSNSTAVGRTDRAKISLSGHSFFTPRSSWATPPRRDLSVDLKVARASQQ